MISIRASKPKAAAPVDTTSRYQEKREAILSAAARLFSEQGVRGATLGGIAAAVGLATNSVTYYYRKKEDLATACYLRSIAVLDELAQAAAHHRAVDARVQAFFAGYGQLLADIESGRHAPMVTFNDIRALPSPQAEQVFAAYTDMFRRLRALLKGTQTAHLGRDELNARTHALLSVAHWVRTWISRYETQDHARATARVADCLLHGLRGPRGRWRPADGEAAWQLGDEQGKAGEALLRAATLLVNEQGYRGASVDKISARLNLTKGSFYHHNDNKHDVITGCFERSFAVMRRALDLGSAQLQADGFGRAAATARALVRYQLSAEGPLLRATAISALPGDAHRAQVRATMNRLTQRMADLLVDGMQDGSVRPLDPAVAAQGLLAAINASAELQRWVPSARADSVAELYMRPVFEGLLA